MTIFTSQLIQIKKELLVSQSIDHDPSEFEVRKENTVNLMLEAYSLSFSNQQDSEEKLYEIYYTLAKRLPRFVVEVKSPIFFRPKLNCIKFNKFLWSLISDEKS